MELTKSVTIPDDKGNPGYRFDLATGPEEKMSLQITQLGFRVKPPKVNPGEALVALQNLIDPDG